MAQDESNAQITLSYSVDLDETIPVTPLRTLFALGDNQAHRFEIRLMHGAKPVDLTGYTVSAEFTNFTTKAATVVIDGNVENGAAVVVLPKPCYTMDGRFVLVIHVKRGEPSTAVFYGDGYMRRTSSETLIDGDYIIYDVATLLEKIAEINAATAAANTAASGANAAASNAQSAANRATTASDTANAAANRLDGMSATASGLPSGSAPTVSVTTNASGVKNLAFGIPKGDTGATGPQGPKGDMGGVGSVCGVEPDGSGNVALTAADIGALAKGATAANSSLLGGRPPAHYLTARSLLDNGDFAAPVNQRGADSYSGAGYTIDRWKLLDSSAGLTVGTGSVTISSGKLVQVIPGSLSGMHTLAAMTGDGVLHLYAADIGQTLATSGKLGMGQDTDGSSVVSLGTGTYIWSALYAGAYTADSLPPFVPKGYAAELAQCQRYYYRLTPRTASYPYAFGYCDSATQARLCMALPQTMVSGNPTLTYTAGSYLRIKQAGTFVDITALSLTGVVGHMALIAATSSGMTTHEAAIMMISGGVFEFSADL